MLNASVICLDRIPAGSGAPRGHFRRRGAVHVRAALVSDSPLAPGTRRRKFAKLKSLKLPFRAKCRVSCLLPALGDGQRSYFKILNKRSVSLRRRRGQRRSAGAADRRETPRSASAFAATTRIHSVSVIDTAPLARGGSGESNQRILPAKLAHWQFARQFPADDVPAALHSAERFPAEFAINLFNCAYHQRFTLRRTKKRRSTCI